MKIPSTPHSAAFFLTSFGMGIILLFLFVFVGPVHSDDHKELTQRSKNVYEHAFKNEDHGNETTGEITACLFGLAIFQSP